MKKYKQYMDSIGTSDSLHQRLVNLEEPGERPIPWKRFGAMAAALVLVAGLGVYGVYRWNGGHTDEVFRALRPGAETALEDPNGDLPGEKTLGSYDVTVGSGSSAAVTHYILPYIDYGTGNFAAPQMKIALDVVLGEGYTEDFMSGEEVAVLLGGQNVLSDHLAWDDYELSGRQFNKADGSIGLIMIYGYAGPMDHFEFNIMEGRLPPSCVAYPDSVTQEIRGLTVTADKYDGKDGCDRRVSFMIGTDGYCFDLTSTDVQRAEELVSRLVNFAADRGLRAAEPSAGTYICPECGEDVPVGRVCWRTHGENGSASTEPYNPDEVAECGMPDPDRPPALTVLCGGDSLEARRGSSQWTVHLGNGESSILSACGFHPLDMQDIPSLSTSADTAKLSFTGQPDHVRVVCWPDSQLGNSSEPSEKVPVAQNELTLNREFSLKAGGWIYEVTAEWDNGDRASYVVCIVKN